jgi:hypothetical protein
MPGLHMSRTRTVAAASVSVVVVALLAACSTQTEAPTTAASDSSPTPSTDPRMALTDRLLTLTEFPLANWREENTLLLPLPDDVEESPTLSAGTATPTAAPRTLCDAADANLVFETTAITEASGLVRLFAAGGYLLELLLVDESGELAETLQGQIQDCIDAGPVPPDSSFTLLHGWAPTVPQADGMFTAQFGALEESTKVSNITAIGIAHEDGITLVTLSDIKDLRTVLTPEEFVQITASMYDKLTP